VIHKLEIVVHQVIGHGGDVIPHGALLFFGPRHQVVIHAIEEVVPVPAPLMNAYERG
jgi:hypothetical protein